MKIKPSRKPGKVVLEMGADEAQLPATVLPELKLKRILVPVDFSEPSRKALHYAISFAKQFNAEILLLHSVELPPPPPELTVPESDLAYVDVQKAAKNRLSDWSKQVGPGASIIPTVRLGNPYFQIVEGGPCDGRVSPICSSAAQLNAWCDTRLAQ